MVLYMYACRGLKNPRFLLCNGISNRKINLAMKYERATIKMKSLKIRIHMYCTVNNMACMDPQTLSASYVICSYVNLELKLFFRQVITSVTREEVSLFYLLNK